MSPPISDAQARHAHNMYNMNRNNSIIRIDAVIVNAFAKMQRMGCIFIFSNTILQ